MEVMKDKYVTWYRCKNIILLPSVTWWNIVTVCQRLTNLQHIKPVPVCVASPRDR